MINITNKKDFKLDELREILKDHPAFPKDTKLQILAKRYNIKIIYLPKFHCEMSPIEGDIHFKIAIVVILYKKMFFIGFWAWLKYYVRKHNTQQFSKFSDLIIEARTKLEKHILNVKLWRRFWRTMMEYNEGCDYKEVMQKYYGAKCESQIQEHRKINYIHSDKL